MSRARRWARRRVRQQGASRVFPATRMRCRRTQRGCGDAHTECCVRMWCLIARPLGRGWVCVWRGADGRGGGGGAGWHALRGEGETSTNTVCPPGLSGMVRVSDVPHWTKSAGTTPPPTIPCLLERAASVRPHAYARGRVRVCVCVCVGLHEPDNKKLS